MFDQRQAMSPELLAKMARMQSVASQVRTRVGRNEPCPCGSGRKFKHCHLAMQQGNYEPQKRDPAKQPRLRGEQANSVVIDDAVVQEAAAATRPPAGKNATATAMLRAKVSERIVWAYLETGFYITDSNKLAHPPERLAAWEAALTAYDNATPDEQKIMLAPATE